MPNNWSKTSELKNRDGVLLGWNASEGLHLLIWRCGHGYMYKGTTISAAPDLVSNVSPPSQDLATKGPGGTQ